MPPPSAPPPARPSPARRLLRSLLFASAPVVAGWGVPLEAAAPDTARPWTRWWWLGNAVDEQGLTAQLEAFAAAGIGGVEITPIYGVRGADEREVPFLSKRWLELLAHTGREARRLGLGVDMATGTGWPFGGPWVRPEHGSQRIVFGAQGISSSPTGMQVKRAAPGAEGLVINPYSTAALDAYLGPFSHAFAEFPRDLIRAQFHDSFEYYNAEWAPELAETFRRMHGYDLADHAAELAGSRPCDADTLARLKADYRATLAELHLAYLTRWRDWSHERGWIIRNQSHGAPANLLDLYGTADIPETETFGSTPFPIPRLRREWVSKRDIPDPLVLRMASSAAHVNGRALASSETCTWLREHWQEPLSAVKPEIDRLFACGINHVLFHGTAYSPADAAWPGWLFYASTQFNPQNPLWRDLPALTAYITRVQSVLQSGSPDNEVLLYWPFHDTLHTAQGTLLQFGVHERFWVDGTSFERAARALIDAGHGVDFISDAQLLGTQMADDALVSPGGNRHRALVVPGTRHMPVATLEQLRKLLAEGARVVFADGPPDDVPGFGNLDARRARMGELLATPELRAAVSGTQPWLERLGIEPEPAARLGLEHVRRTRPEGHDYFIANLSGQAFDGWLPLAKRAGSVLLVDPLTGRPGVPALRNGARTEVALQLAPGESVLLLARTQSSAEDAPQWNTTETAGDALTLSGLWETEFIEGGPGLPPAFSSEDPQLWSGRGGEAERFSGTARYSTDFELPRSAVDDWLLDLGDVRESARLRINGIEVGTLWSLPFRARVGAHLRPGRNRIEIEVTGLAANRIRDLDRRGVAWRIMKEINFVNLDYKPFDASSWTVTPSGLAGPVRLTPLRHRPIL